MRAPRPLSPAAALLPLRVFLGATFAYAGVQKLSDPGFLAPGAPTYIGTQLHGFAQGTPGGWLLRTFALPHPGLAGVGVAVVEIAVGVLMLLGLATRAAALVGLGLNLVLFLTASWHTSPYFLGSDIVFVFAWLPFVLAGSAGQPALERSAEGASSSRREFLGAAWGGAAGAVALIAGVAVALRGAPPTRAAARGPAAAAPRPRHRHRRHRRASGPPSGGVRLASSNRLARDSGALYRDPADGQADIVVRHADGSLSACSAICTHAGCRVEYQAGALLCPCHGSIFDSRTGAVRQGPATQPLAVKRVVEEGGSIYAVPS
ncbi:MAG TPA: TQO small subunit DoxD [Solirubrobacteraceae bacterium]|nr:TQO small subunit DoxD [Solirubrobacteraceae bacterium]